MDYTESYEPTKEESIELFGVEASLKHNGYSTVSIVDLNLKNRGSLPGNISKLRIDVKEVFGTKPFGVLVQNFDDGKAVPLDQVGEQKLREFIESGNKSLMNLTQNVIGSVFQGGTNSPGLGARVPPVPYWFKS